MNQPSETVRRVYEALGQNDLPRFLELLDPHIQWTEAERFPYYGGTWRGPEVIVKGLLEPLARDWSRFEVKPRNFVAAGDEVVCFGTYAGTHRRTGRSLVAPFAHRWTVSNGRIIRFVQYTDTAKVLEAIGD